MSDTKDMQNACYICKHRGDIPGNFHSRCNHPAFKKVASDPLMQLASIMGGGVTIKSEECVVESVPQGARWFSHPTNFDPVWLISCTGFESKEPTL